ncbi:MAG TPA: hypothetical protein VKR22_08825 [Acidimicrobiales bacterium]|nr:hypothetical protein [Acidimicrobiales bacterium]
MLDVHFVILGAVIGTLGTAKYLWDTLRGTTQPNRVTWLLWAVAPLLAFAVELHEGVGLQALMTFTVGFCPLLVFVASFWSPGAAWRIGRLDYLCGLLSLAGLVLWLATRHGTVAIVASIAADGLAALPTLRKSLLAPHTETAAAYATAAVNAALTLLTVKHLTTAVIAFPLYIVSVASLETVLIVGRVGPRLRSLRATPLPTAET